ncbi:MAG: TatD family hydrolase [Gammaproteobacteria bacterium]
MLVDSHCHLTLLDPGQCGSTEQVLAAAKREGVDLLLCVSVDIESAPEIIRLATTHEEIFASVGVHPNTAAAIEPGFDDLVALAADPCVIAVGETGLDYYRSEGDLAWQRDRFKTHIAVAKALRKPLIIHNREATEDVLKILRQDGAHAVGGVMHCFVDTWETAERAMDLGFYISFSGIVTFRNAKSVQEVARRLPLERMLVETDAPYLAPVPHRGKCNQPAYVRYVAEYIAELKGLPAQEVFAATTRNFVTLFKPPALP